MAALAQLVGDPHLAVGRELQRQLDDQRLHLGRRPVRQKRLAPAQLLQRHLAAGLVELLEAIEAVPRIAHHLAGLAHVPELLRELQQPHLRTNDLLVLGHVDVLQNAEAGRSTTLNRSTPGLGSHLSFATLSVRSSADFYSSSP